MLISPGSGKPACLSSDNFWALKFVGNSFPGVLSSNLKFEYTTSMLFSLLRPCSRRIHASVGMNVQRCTDIRRVSTDSRSQAATQSLTWSQYLEIRRQKRRWETVVVVFGECSQTNHIFSRQSPSHAPCLVLPVVSRILGHWKLTRPSPSW